jgi:hypothetical protein
VGAMLYFVSMRFKVRNRAFVTEKPHRAASPTEMFQITSHTLSSLSNNEAEKSSATHRKTTNLG